jgi:hypothetical protein
MYIVKRPAYEFCFAVPRQQANRTGRARPLLQIRFKDQCQMPVLVLEISQMGDFFEGLNCFMEYVRAEADKRAGGTLTGKRDFRQARGLASRCPR